MSWLCYRNLSSQFKELKFRKLEALIKTSISKFTENNQKFITYQTSALKAEKKKTSDYLWSTTCISRLMFDSFLILDICFAVFVKSGGSLNS